MIRIVYASDDNYAEQLTISIFSLLKNVSKVCEIYVLDNGISNQHKSIIHNISKNHNCIQISYIDISDIEKRLGLTVAINSLSLSTYARLFLPELIPNHIDKILYLDCDTMINCDIEELYSIDLGNSLVGGVIDTMFPQYITSIGLKEDDIYINAGVLLINIKRWRETNIQKSFLDFIKKFNGNVPHLDQGVINGVFTSKKVLPLAFNVQTPVIEFHNPSRIYEFFNLKTYYTEQEVIEAKNCPKIIHFTASFLQRPWFSFCLHPMRKQYRKIKREIGFTNALQKSPIPLSLKLKSFAFYYLQPIYLKLRKSS